MMKSLMTLLLVFLFQGVVHADPSGNCTDFFKVFDEMKFQRLVFEPKDCSLSASPRAALTTYRAYYTSSQGKFMIFDSYHGGDTASGTAAKVYHFFPRDRHPTIVDDANGRVELMTANNKVSFKFNQQKAILTEMYGGILDMNHDITPAAQGGVQIKSADVLVLESGFARGTDPTSIQKGKSTFRDSNGNTCTVVNTEVFIYFKGGDNKFEFNDAQLKNFLKTRCPNINPGY